MANIPLTQGMDLGSGGGGSGKPSLQFSVPCLEVEDEAGKPPSFRYLFYELPLPQFPFKASFYVSNGWCHGQGSFVQTMKILKPNREVLVETGQQPFQLSELTVPFMAVNFFSEIPFEAPGTYWMQVNLDGKTVLEYPLTVRQAQAK